MEFILNSTNNKPIKGSLRTNQEKLDLIISILLEIKEQKVKQPLWIQRLIDDGLVDTDGRTVLTNSLMTVAAHIRDQNIVVTQHHLNKFIKPGSLTPYSKSTILKTIEAINT